MKQTFTDEQRRYLLISGVMIIAGILFYGIYREIIIFNLPSRRQYTAAEHRTAQQKKINLWYWNGERFIEDEKELIDSANPQDMLTNLVARWLSFLDEEEALPKKVGIQSVLLGLQKHTAYISFDRTPFTKEQSTFEKLMFLEGLLKTIRASSATLKKVRFLVNHKPLQDPHIDCDHDWSISGYLNRT